MAQQTVTLAPGESKVVSFSFTPQQEGIYHVTVDGLTGTFTAVIKIKVLPAAVQSAAEQYITKWGNGGYIDAVTQTYKAMGENYTLKVIAADEVLAAARSWNPGSEEAATSPQSSAPTEAAATITYTDFGGGFGYSATTGPVTPWGYGW